MKVTITALVALYLFCSTNSILKTITKAENMLKNDNKQYLNQIMHC